MQIMRVVLLALGFGLGGGAADAAGPVTLIPTSPLAKEVAAFPRLEAAPGDTVAARINKALGNADARAKGMIKDCRENGGPHARPSRTVSAAMRGAGYLSFYAVDLWDCGGAHPDNSEVALAYDLTTGSPLNWDKLIPATLAKSKGTATGDDGTVLGQVAGPALAALYLKAADVAKVDPGCPDAYKDQELAFILWPDAEGDGVGIQPTPGIFPFAVEACAPPATIKAADLRPLGVNAAFLDAIDEAHRNGWFDKTAN